MDNRAFFLYLALMAATTYLIRAVPFAAVRGKIRNRFLRSFLYYIPYAVLSAMTLPGALYAGARPLSAGAGLVTAALFSLKGKSLTFVAAAACAVTLLFELLLLPVFGIK